ncbi:HAMP domain-containing sensor histidine kinase [Vallitalea longa]|uniref:HAMP domain-containing sensor histidine kinase n=1 Tax=Vallitalea longa TaxID=2936439 RepID=UPI00248FCC8B|nr:HAMP domain-containing sensor histidine kinase [Vallitalea longa]
MKIKSINLKLMMAFFGVIIFFGVITYTLLVSAFNNYYHEDIYRVLEDNTHSNEKFTDIDEFINDSDDNRSIEQLFWVKINGKLTRKDVRRNDIITSELTDDVIKVIEDDIKNQTEESKRYSFDVNGRKLFYVITQYRLSNSNKLYVVPKLFNRPKITVAYNTLYRVTLRWEPANDILQKQLFSKMALGLFLTIVAILIVFFFLSRHLTKPLIDLSKSVKQISKRKFETPIDINRNDEIGVLANTVEEMRRELLKYDKEQKLQLHSISHELKTPIMVIQSYVDALKKGLYPKGTQEASLEIIEEESNRLQKLVYNLLYIQRLDYFESEIKNQEKINIKEVVKDVVCNMQMKLDNFNLETNLEDVFVRADYNQMRIVIENLLSNQIRYADKAIRITLEYNGESSFLEFYNDGEHIADVNDLFMMFKKGKKGQSGLGLYIVKRLLDINGGTISAYNRSKGVTFKIEWK